MAQQMKQFTQHSMFTTNYTTLLSHLFNNATTLASLSLSTSPASSPPLQPGNFTDYFGDEVRYVCQDHCGISQTLNPNATLVIYNRVLLVYTLPIIAIAGLCGNLASFIIFIQPGMLNSMNCYLAALAVSDISVLFTSFFMFTFESLRHANKQISELYLMGISGMYPLGTIAHTCSIYFCLSADFDCFFRECIPCLKRWCCRVPVAKVVILFTVILAIGYNGPHFLEVIVTACFNLNTNTTHREVCASPLRMNPDYNIIYYVYLYTLVMVVGPLLLLIVLTSIIVAVLMLRKRRKHYLYFRRQNSPISALNLSHQQMLQQQADLRPMLDCSPAADATPPTTHDKHMLEEAVGEGNDGFVPASPYKMRAVDSGTAVTKTHAASNGINNGTATVVPKRTIRPSRKSSKPAADDGPTALLMVVLLFIVCNSLGMIVNFLESYADIGEILNYLVDGSNLLVVVNSSANFFLYVAFDSKFSRTLNEMLVKVRNYCCCCCCCCFNCFKKAYIPPPPLVVVGRGGQTQKRLSDLDSTYHGRNGNKTTVVVGHQRYNVTPMTTVIEKNGYCKWGADAQSVQESETDLMMMQGHESPGNVPLMHPTTVTTNFNKSAAELLL